MKRMEWRYGRRGLAWLLALALWCLSVPVAAETVAPRVLPEEPKEEPTVSEALTLEAKDTLPVTYARDESDPASARQRLGSVGRAMYDLLVPEFAAIAAGERASVVFTYDAATLAALGLDNRYSVPEGQESRIVGAFSEGMELDNLLSALVHDCPYELFWFDKTAGVDYQFRLGRYESGEYFVSSFTMIYYVSVDYQGAGYPAEMEEEPRLPLYSVDTAKTAAASAVLGRAEQIVAEGEGLSDYQRLRLYADAICALTSYNSAVASLGQAAPYGNAFQLIHVFDGDPDTKVVCEGYAKAFQYLCDLTEFNNPAVACYTVTGLMDGESHMWNLITMGNGERYLVDVTNSDEGSSGAAGQLFLAGASYGSAKAGYRIRINAFQSIVYQYYVENVLALWGSETDSVLTLSTDAYEPSEIFIYVPPLTYDGEALSAGLPDSGAKLLYSCDGGADRNDEYTWSSFWYADEGGAAGVTPTTDAPRLAGTYWLKVRAVGTDVKEKYAKVVISPAPLGVTGVVEMEKVYDGSRQIELSELSVTGALNGDDVSFLGALAALPDADVGEYASATVHSVTLGGADRANYCVPTPCELAVTVRVIPRRLVSPELILSQSEYEYSGEAILPPLRLTDGEEIIDPAQYAVAVEDNLEIGQAAVTVRAREGGNYEFAPLRVFFTITKRTPSVTLPEGLTATVGQTLGEVALPHGFSWQDGSDTPVGEEGSHCFLVTYTPDDEVHQRALTDLEVTLLVRPIPDTEEEGEDLFDIFFDNPMVLAASVGGIVVMGTLLGVLVTTVRRKRTSPKEELDEEE